MAATGANNNDRIGTDEDDEDEADEDEEEDDAKEKTGGVDSWGRPGVIVTGSRLVFGLSAGVLSGPNSESLSTEASSSSMSGPEEAEEDFNEVEDDDDTANG